MKQIHLTKAVWINTFAIALSIPLAMPVQAQVKFGFATNYSPGPTYRSTSYSTGTTYGSTAYGTTKTYGGTSYGTGTSYASTAYGTTKTYGGTSYGNGTTKTYHLGTNNTATTYGGTVYGTVKTYHPGINGTEKTYSGTAYGIYNTGTNGAATPNSIDTMNETHLNSTNKTYSTGRNYGKGTYQETIYAISKTSKTDGKTTYQGTIYSISKTSKTPTTNSLNIKNSNGKNFRGVKNATLRKNGNNKNYGGMVLSKNIIRASLKDAKNYQTTNTPSDSDRFDWSWRNWGGLLSLSASVVALFSYRLLSDRYKSRRSAVTRRSGCRSYTFMLTPKLSLASQNRLRGNHILLQRDRAFNQPTHSRSYTLSAQFSAARQTSTDD